MGPKETKLNKALILSSKSFYFVETFGFIFLLVFEPTDILKIKLVTTLIHVY